MRLRDFLRKVLSLFLPMDITRGSTNTPTTDTATPIIDTASHTVDTSTTLLVVTFHCFGDNTISDVFWSGDEAMTLITSVDDSAGTGDCRVYAFGLVNPTVETGSITWTLGGAGDNLSVVPVNYLGTETSSVAAATNVIDTETNGHVAATTVALSGATTSGSTLVVAGTFFGGDGDPSSETTASFNTVQEGATGTATSADNSYFYGDLIGGGTGGTVSPTIDWTGAASDECVGIFFEILPPGNITATGTITATAVLAGTGGTSFAFGTSTAIGDVAATAANLAFGTSTITGTLIATGDIAPVALPDNGVAFASAQHRFYEVTPQSVFANAIPSVAAITATGTITFSAQISQGAGVTRAFGTITVAGDLVATAASKVFGTSTASGDLVADGASNVFAVTSFIGTLIAGGGASFAFGTTTFSGTLSAIGTNLGAAVPAPTTPIITRQPPLPAVAQPVLLSGVLSPFRSAKATTRFRGTLFAIADVVGLYGLSQSGVSLSSAQHRYYNRDIPAFVSRPIIEDGATTATGTITASAQVAASGTQLAGGTATFSGQLAANGINLNAEAPPTGALFSVGLPFPSRNQRTLNVGLVTIASPIVRAFGVVRFSASLAATSDSGVKFPVGTITAIGSLSAQSGNVQVSGTISFLGAVRAGTGDVIAVVAGSTSVFVDEIPAPAAYVWLHRGPPPSLGARGTIRATATLSVGNDIQRFAFATSTAIGSVAATAKTRAFATSTMIGSLAGVGVQGVKRAFGTITFIGAVVSVSGNIQPKATITTTSSLFANGTNPSAIVVPTATITATATLFGKGKSFCSVKASGTITISLSLSATEDPTNNRILAKGRIQPFGGTQQLQFSGFNDGGFDYLVDPTTVFPSDLDGQRLVNVTKNREGRIVTAFGNLVFWDSPSGWDDGDAYEIYELVAAPSLRAAGTISGDGAGTFYAYATITFAAQLSQAKFTRVSCIRPIATITMLGATMSAFGGDLNQKRASATITLTSTLSVSAVYARATVIRFTGSLTALGRNLPIGTSAMLAQAAIFGTLGQIGPGTIDGQKKAIIRNAYGSLELYNNSQGGFYSIGNSAAVKEIFGLINFTSLTTARGTRDATKFARGTINVVSSVTAYGRQNAIAAIINSFGSLQVVANFAPRGTIVFKGDLAARTIIDFAPTYNGAQSPLLIGDAYGTFQDLSDGSALGGSNVNVVLENSASDCLIKTIGSFYGFVIDQGSYANTAGSTVFNLNTRPDNVKIRRVSSVINDAGGSSGSGKVGTFTDNLAFDAANGTQYGYSCSSESEVFAPDFIPVTDTGEINVTVEFTFIKDGYNDLIVTYKIRSASRARARSI